jgi:hypothetical protein
MPITPDRSVLDQDGRLVFCSPSRFVADICEGDHCFICGRDERDVDFNREHILPDWLLHQFDLHRNTMTLPNSERHPYGTYTVPCCIDCNTRLGQIFETSISNAFAKGYTGVEALVAREGPDRLFQWLALIFLKLHLKDCRLRKHLDRRLGDASISETYTWHHFHHIHCLARAHFTGAAIGDHVLGSLILMKLVPDPDDEPFDLASVTDAYTLMLRADDLAVFAVFNDAIACVGAIDPILERITGPLNPLQARELAAELAAAKLHLENPPLFRSEMADGDGAELQILADVEPGGPRFLDKDPGTVGFVKHFLLQHALGNVSGRSREESVDLIRRNRLSFLFDDEGVFIQSGRQPASL